MKHFDWLLGMEFTIKTDHKPLVNALPMTAPSPQQSRWLSFISEFACKVEYLAGSDNVVADALSRPACGISVIFDENFAKAQVSDADLQKFLATTERPLKRLTIGNTDLVCDAARPQLRPFVPSPFRHQVFSEVHNLAHLSARATTDAMLNTYMWPGLKRDIKRWCRECTQCQKSKIVRHTKAPLGSIPTTGRFHTIHVDLVGPLPACSGHRYLLTVVDRFTRWPVAVPLPDIGTETVARALISEWISVFGLPRVLITDRGSQSSLDFGTPS